MSSTAERLRWVVDTLDPQPGDDVLELGRVRPGRDLRRLMGFLRPGGRLWLFYEAFAPARA